MRLVPKSLRRKARNPEDAKDRYRGYIQGTVRCVNKTVQLYVAPSPLGSGNSVTLGAYTNPIPLTTSTGNSLYLLLQQQGQIIKDGRFRGEYRITTRSYHYALSLDPESKLRIIDWDWHPGTTPAQQHPHIHTGINDPLGRGARLHIPTGKRVTIEQVVGFIVREMDVLPVAEDWEETLADHQHRFDKYQVQDRPP